MTTLAAGASYTSSAAVINLVQGSLTEHGVVLGANTSILLVLALGCGIHYLSNKYGNKNSGELPVPFLNPVSSPVPTFSSSLKDNGNDQVKQTVSQTVSSGAIGPISQ